MTMNVASLAGAAAAAAAGEHRGGVLASKGGRPPESPAARLSRELLSDEAIDALVADAGDGGSG